MVKKILELGIAFIMLFSIAGLTACEDLQLQKDSFFSLQDAYDGGILTRDDIKHISYFATGRVVEVLDATGNEWES